MPDPHPGASYKALQKGRILGGREEHSILTVRDSYALTLFMQVLPQGDDTVEKAHSFLGKRAEQSWSRILHTLTDVSLRFKRSWRTS